MNVGPFADVALVLLGLMARLAGWRPDDFWAATPADAAAVLAGWRDEEAGGMGQADLAAMMEQCPDG
ncbi:phage tail assembly chaperone [Sphingopyxis lindanitolerans]